MPVNYYPNLTDPTNADGETELVGLLEALQRRATIGQLYMTSYGGDQHIRSFQGSSTVRSEIRNVLYALHLRDSTTWDNPYTQRIRRVSAAY
jgi:hypothetical protein